MEVVDEKDEVQNNGLSPMPVDANRGVISDEIRPVWHYETRDECRLGNKRGNDKIGPKDSGKGRLNVKMRRESGPGEPTVMLRG